MKFYSELTKMLYDTEEALVTAETKIRKEEADKKAREAEKNAARAKRAKEVEAAYDASVKAEAKYKKLLNAFVKDYGSYHMTLSTRNTSDVSAILDNFFKVF